MSIPRMSIPRSYSRRDRSGQPSARRNLVTLLEIRRLLQARDVDRSLVRILDALLWSRDAASGSAALPKPISETAEPGGEGGTIPR